MTLPSEPLKERWFLRLLILKRTVWWPQKDEKEKKKYEICWSMPGIEPGSPGWNARVLTLLSKGVDFNKVYYMIKAPISPILHYPRLRWSILAIKAYLLL
jgi:hypothetical protein